MQSGCGYCRVSGNSTTGSSRSSPCWPCEFLRRLPADKALNFSAAAARRMGPWFGRHRTAVDNLRHAYPEKSAEEIEAIALDMWSNMAKLGAEYIFLDTLFDFDPDNRQAGRIEIIGEERFLRIAAEKQPHILFTAHLGNFELLPIAGGIHGMAVTALFRPPNNPYIADYILSTRRSTMGGLLESSGGAAFSLASTLEKGGNIGILVDQKFIGGLETTFFGRLCETNPVVPMLARRFECDVYPTRCTRLPGNRYRLEIEDKLDLPRNSDGDIDVPGFDADAQRRRRALGPGRSRTVDVVPQALVADRPPAHRALEAAGCRARQEGRAFKGPKLGSRRPSRPRPIRRSSSSPHALPRQRTASVRRVRRRHARARQIVPRTRRAADMQRPSRARSAAE